MKKIILLIVALLCTSCYDYQEVNKVSIVNGIGIDYINNEYIVNYEIIKIDSNNNSSMSNSYIISSNGKTIDEAINNISFKLPKKENLSHLEIMVISKEIANNKLLDIGNYFLKNNSITTNFYLVVSNNPYEILNNKNDSYPINSKAIHDLLIKYNIKSNQQFDYLISDIINNKNIYIPYITLDNKTIILNNYYLLEETT